MTLLDALRQDGHAPVYVETDDSNSDVYKAVNDTVRREICTWTRNPDMSASGT